MTFIRLIAGRHGFARGILGILLLLLASGIGVAADRFPFDQEFLLEATPMRPAKRMPILTVAPDGNATIDLWCKTVQARMEITDATVKIEPGPLPEALPEMMSDGQCTPPRMQADEDILVALTQATAWRKQGSVIMLVGPKTLKFRASDH